MRKIAILGTAPACRDIAPFHDQSWDIWGCSPGNMGVLPRVTVWFELHAIGAMVSVENKAWSLTYFDWLAKQTFPIYMQEKNDYVPGAIEFPYRKIIDRFKTRNWFTSSPAWMMAFAIMQMKAGDEIGIFGVDMAAPEEYYTMQKGGLIYWMEMAQQLGITVTVPLESCLGSPTPLYGYYEASRFGRRMEVIKGQIAAGRSRAIAERDRAQVQLAFYDGAAEQTAYILRTFVDGMDDSETGTKASEIMEKKSKEYAEQATRQQSSPAWTAPVMPSAPETYVPNAGGVLVPANAAGNGAALGAGPMGTSPQARETHGRPSLAIEGA